MKDTIHLPTLLCFHGEKKQIRAILHDHLTGHIEFEDGTIQHSWYHSSVYAFKLCQQTIPKQFSQMELWSIHVDGKDMRLNVISHFEFVKTMNKINFQDSVVRTYDTLRTPPVFSALLERKKIDVNEKMLIDEEENDELRWTPEDHVWNTSELEEYLVRYPTKYPNLLRITGVCQPEWLPKDIGNPYYRCIFEHPILEEERDLYLSATSLYRISPYKVKMEEYIKSTS